MDYFIVIIAGLLIIIGLVGCIVPVLPGPPLSWVGLILLKLSVFGADISSDVIISTAVFAALVTLLDYLLPIWTTKKFGGSKRGVWGATIGLLIGMFLFPPIGIIVGPFAGAYIGEATGIDKSINPWKSALGSFVGFLLGTGIKFAVSGYITYIFIVEVFS